MLFGDPEPTTQRKSTLHLCERVLERDETGDSGERERKNKWIIGARTCRLV